MEKENKKQKSKENKKKTVETKTLENKKITDEKMSDDEKNTQKDSAINKSVQLSESEQIKKQKEKEQVQKKSSKPKKTEAVVYGTNLPLSTKNAAAICRFIKNKKIENAIADLEQVLLHKKAIPMKGEIPHRKGKIMSGRYHDKTTKYFIRLLKSLMANANTNELNEPVIVEGIANIASRPYGRFGRTRKKRTHVKIKAMEKSISENKNQKKK